jgi:hypothetical protein
MGDGRRRRNLPARGDVHMQCKRCGKTFNGGNTKYVLSTYVVHSECFWS